MTRNIRERRGEKVAINIPGELFIRLLELKLQLLNYIFCVIVFKDINTASPFKEDFSQLGDDGERGKAALDDHVYLDAMGFGMGCCCLQLTFQACNINEARTLYDQLATMCPIMVC